MTNVQAGASAEVPSSTEEQSIDLDVELCLRNRNQGKWGDDERGTPNFMTPEALVHAPTLIRIGQVVTAARWLLNHEVATLATFTWGAACAEEAKYEFPFTPHPLPIPGAVGSLINPIAVF